MVNCKPHTVVSSLGAWRGWRHLGCLAILVAASLPLGCSDDAESAGSGAAPPNYASTDADGDTISDAHEGYGEAEPTNSDDDDWADWLDLDSDGDGIPDAEEAGDDDLATPPVDTDGDEIADFRDTDSDDDSLSDTDELDPEFLPVDTDEDGAPDHLDSDSDGDTIDDSTEGAADTDGDGTANFRDDDSDNDGLPDALEAGDADLSTPPIDTDADGLPDYLDLDSDDDFVPDSQEDKNGNGVVDDGESSPLHPDTDGDGTPDIIEIIAGSDPNDPDETIPEGDFYFVLPYLAPGEEGPLDFATTVQQADVFFSMDTTGSFGEEIAAVQASLTDIIADITTVIPDVAFGVGRFEDMPLEPWGLPGDVPYQLLQAITTDQPLVQAGLDALPPVAGGLDTPEAGYEALYQWASGTGIAELGYPPFAPSGIGGVGFREDSLPIIIQITDAISHAKADYEGVIDGAHSHDQAVAALNAIGARVIGIDSLENEGTADDPRLQLEDLAIATKAIIPPDQGTGKCLTGVDGAERDPVVVGGEDVCPVVFDVAADGSGLGGLIVDAVVQLAQLGVLDISTALVGEIEGLNGEPVVDGHTTADFIKSVTPVPPAPAGATIDGDVFRNVTPGSGVTFQVVGENDFQPPLETDQLFQADIHVLGDIITLLDVRNVYIIVPRKAEAPVPQ